MKTWLSWAVIVFMLLVPAAAIANSSGLRTLSHLVAQASTAVNPDLVRVTRDALLAGVDRPNAQPEVYRTVIEDHYALASWHWGEIGGQSVLSKTSGQWQVLSSGGGVHDIFTLEQAGVPPDTAQRLIERDRAAWQQY